MSSASAASSSSIVAPGGAISFGPSNTGIYIAVGAAVLLIIYLIRKGKI